MSQKLCLRKSALLTIPLVAVALALTACSSAPAAAPAQKAAAPAAGAPTADKPMVVDAATRTIRIYATVNGKHLIEPTRHGLNFKDGKNAPHALFITPVDQDDFYHALVGLQAKPGNNLTIDSKGQKVEGQPLDVSVTWANAKKEYDINEVVVDSTGTKIEYRFGGNLEASRKYLTGCFLCLDSCPVGIASNHNHAFGEFEAKKVEFRGNMDLLPPDGTPLTITVKVKDAQI